MMRIFTIGYEGATVAEFLDALRTAGVERVIDVRAVPNSRRPGFSKTPLRNALAEAGIDYVHLRPLGTPADGRAAARAGRIEDLERIYAAQLDLPEAIVAAQQMRRFNGVLTFELESADAVNEFLARSKLVSAATSFGGLHSTADRRAQFGDPVPEGLVRFSAGCEDTRDLVADVSHALGLD